MPTTVDDLLFRIEADTRSLRQSMSQAEDVVARSSSRMERAFGGVSSAAARLGPIIGVAIAALSVQKISQSADAFTRISNALKLVTNSSQELQTVQSKLFDVSQKTRTEFEGTVQLYRRLALTSKELGANQDQLIGFTEGIGQALTISGASAQSASGALLQLSQAVGAGTVRAEEFNSILEGAPRIAQAVADGLGKAGGSVAKLRSLIIEGSVSSKEFFDAFLTQLPKLKEEFDKTETTIGQAFTTLSNSSITLVGALDDLTGASKGFAFVLGLLSEAADENARVFNRLAGVFKTIEAQQKALETGDIIKLDTRELEGLRNKIISEIDKIQARIDEAGAQGARLSGAEALLEKRLDLLRKINAELERQKKGAGQPIAAETTTSAPTGARAAGGGRPAAQGPTVDEIRATTAELVNLTEALSMGGAAHREMARDIEIAAQASEVMAGATEEQRREWIRANRELHEAERSYQDVARVLEEIKTPQDKVNDQIQRLNELFDEGAISADVYGMKMGQLKQALAETDPIIGTLSRSFDGLGKQIVSSMRSGASAMETLRDIATRVMDDIQAAILQAAVIDPIKKSIIGGITGGGGGGGLLGGLGGIISDIGGLFGFANGAAINNGKVTPFARGGIASSPTFFPMANGGTGVAGEAGTEGILPLARTPSGDLGVKTVGSGMKGSQFFIDARGADREGLRMLADRIRLLDGTIETRAVNAVFQKRTRGGKFSEAFA